MTTIAALRTTYNNLRSSERLANNLPSEVVYQDAAFGEIAIPAATLRALDLDNLFSGRWTGESVESALFGALHSAADAADPDDAMLPFTVRFGALVTARLFARLTGEGIVILPA